MSSYRAIDDLVSNAKRGVSLVYTNLLPFSQPGLPPPSIGQMTLYIFITVSIGTLFGVYLVLITDAIGEHRQEQMLMDNEIHNMPIKVEYEKVSFPILPWGHKNYYEEASFSIPVYHASEKISLPISWYYELEYMYMDECFDKPPVAINEDPYYWLHQYTGEYEYYVFPLKFNFNYYPSDYTHCVCDEYHDDYLRVCWSSRRIY